MFSSDNCIIQRKLWRFRGGTTDVVTVIVVDDDDVHSGNDSQQP
jgi:hypothetical protein